MCNNDLWLLDNNTYISHCWKWRNVVVVYSNAYHILLHISLTHTSTNLDTKVCTMFLCNTFWSGRLAIVMVVTRWFIHFLAFAKIAKKEISSFCSSHYASYIESPYSGVPNYKIVHKKRIISKSNYANF